jgi:hypothetical protein
MLYGRQHPTLAAMKLISCTVSLAALGCTGAIAATPAAAVSPAASGPLGSSSQRAATAACEQAAQDTLRSGRGPAVTVTFNAPASVVPGPADAVELTLRGAGRVQSASGARPFSFSCSYDSAADKVTGIVVRDAGAPAPAAAPRPVEPDLSHLSPPACESAAADALKRRWPYVSRIAFNIDTRQLSQDANGEAHLQGQGTALPNVGAPATHFSYNCALDASSGRVTGLQLTR